MNKLTTCLWFDHQAEEAVGFYATVFNDVSIGETLRYGKDSPGKEGEVLTISFTLSGQEFIALNGGTIYQLSPATSFLVKCKDQDEIDRYWETLSTGGSEMECGWVTDRFGVTWQIVPEILFDLVNDKDAQKAYRATQAMLKMVKLDIAKLQKAYDGEN
jgi:predicted 3-demethylubiquinone-9 3-methyltransferase (glyoxalase superfamily)